MIPGHVNSFKSTTKSKSQSQNCKTLVNWKRNITYYRKINHLTREFHVEFHVTNRYLAIRAISVFQVKFNLEFMSRVVNFLESHSFSRINFFGWMLQYSMGAKKTAISNELSWLDCQEPANRNHPTTQNFSWNSCFTNHRFLNFYSGSKLYFYVEHHVTENFYYRVFHLHKP